MFVYENGAFTAVPCTKKNSYLSIRDFAEGRDGTIYVASTSGVCRVRSGLLVPYSNPYITGETAYALGIDRYGRLWRAVSTGKVRGHAGRPCAGHAGRRSCSSKTAA